jgi:hypothetical protein
VYGTAKDLAKFKKQAVGYSPWMTSEERAKEKPCGLNFHSLVPIPDQVLKADDQTMGNWTDEHWGAFGGASYSGDASEVDALVGKGVPAVLLYSLDTRWVPPIAFLKNVSKKWPTLLFLLDYTGEGLEFIGIAKAKAGEIEHYQVEL